MSTSGDQMPPPLIVLFPSSGMGHLTPFLRLAVSLASLSVRVTLIVPPPISLAESQSLSHFSSAFPQIAQEHLPLLPSDVVSLNTSEDPFYGHYEAIRRSASRCLPPLLSPPPSAVVTDMSLASAVIPVTKHLGITNFVLFTSSARMLTLFASFHSIIGREEETGDVVRIPGMEAIPRSWVPPPLLADEQSLLKTHIIENGEKIAESDGILINTFQNIELDSLTALNSGRVVRALPPVSPIGLLPPCHAFERREQSQIQSEILAWLDQQPVNSVVLVSFGSRTAMSKDQIRELGEGLVTSEWRFVWMVKEKKVDREDAGELSQVLGEGLLKRVREKGLVLKGWVNQEEVLSHQAVGGFLSHCGWNSVSEAIWHGVPVLAWPQHGDQKMNARVVERIGLGVWVKEWGWGGGGVIKGEEIRKSVSEMMQSGILKEKASEAREEARRAVGEGGSSRKGLKEIIENLGQPFGG